MGSTQVYSDHTDFEDEQDDNELNTINDATVTANANIPNWTTNFTDITMSPLFRKVVPAYLTLWHSCSKSIRLPKPFIQTRYI